MVFITAQSTTNAVREIQQPPSFQNAGERVDAEACVESYGSFIWALAKKFTSSRDEAEAATYEIYQDIWRYSEHERAVLTLDERLVSMIARRRLFKYLLP